MLAALHAHLGIERAVIVQASCHGTDNAAMLDCIASDPKRYRGVAIVDDSFTDADYDKLDAGGVRGVRFNFVKHLGGAPDMAVFNRVIDRIKGRGWHVVLHLDAPEHRAAAPHDPRAAAAVRDRSHGPRAVGGRRRAAAVARPDRAFAAGKLLDQGVRGRAHFHAALCGGGADRPRVGRGGADRVLWGTDFPHPNATHEADEADLVDLVPQFAATPLAQQRLLVDNPARLYGFDNKNKKRQNSGEDHDEESVFRAAGAAALLVALAPLDQAQAKWPEKPVKIVLPFGAGGVADVTSRMMAAKLSDKFGQQVVIENMPGPGGINAARAVINAPPDGYTMALVTNGTAISVAAFNKLPFDPVKDFADGVDGRHLRSGVRGQRQVRVQDAGRFHQGGQGQARQAQHRHHRGRRHAKSRRRTVQVDGRTSMCRSCRTRIRPISWWRCCATTCR